MGGGGDQGGKWEVKSKEGAERLAGVFCFIPVCLRGKRIRQQKKRQRVRWLQRRACKHSHVKLNAKSFDPQCEDNSV